MWGRIVIVVPMWRMLGSFFLMQVVLCVGEFTWWKVAGGGVGCFLILGRKFKGILPVGCGVLLSAVSIWSGSISGSVLRAGEQRVVLEVVSDPRYPKTNALSFYAVVRGVQRAGRGEKGKSSFHSREREKFTDGFVRIESPEKIYCKGTELPCKNAARVKKGSVIVAKIKFSPYQNSLNPFSYQQRALRDGVSGQCKIVYATPSTPGEDSFPERIRYTFLNNIEQHGIESEIASLLVAMSVGGRDGVSDNTERAFKQAGMVHLLVVSGFQVGLICLSLAFIARLMQRFTEKVFVGRTMIVLSIGAVIGYVWLTGVEAPAVRAGVGAIIAVGYMLLQRNGTIVQPMLVSLLFVSMLFPGAIFDPSTELTYGALIGMVLGPKVLSRFGVPKFLSVSIGASFVSSILTLLWFKSFSLIGFILNPVVAPIAATFFCYGGIAAVITAPFFRFISEWMGRAVFHFRETVIALAKIPHSSFLFDERWQATLMAAFLVAVAIWVSLLKQEPIQQVHKQY